MEEERGSEDGGGIMINYFKYIIILKPSIKNT